MKPINIFLVRHGQSEGNLNKEIYKDRPDYALNLTPLGKQQANKAGENLKPIIGDTSVQFYVSPFWRTRQTYMEIRNSFPYDNRYIYYEDPRLREQEWGNNMESREGYKDKIEEYRDSYGHFYYRFRDGGESCADVFDRVSDFMGTLFRDFEKKNFPLNVVIVTHGMAMRVFLMRWYHTSVEEFERWGNPLNGEYFHLKLKDNEKYELITSLKIHKVKHEFQFPDLNKNVFTFKHKLISHHEV